MTRLNQHFKGVFSSSLDVDLTEAGAIFTLYEGHCCADMELDQAQVEELHELLGEWIDVKGETKEWR